MARGPVIVLLLTGIVFLAAFLGRAWSDFSGTDIPSPAMAAFTDSERALLEPGDILLTRGSHWRSQAVHFLQSDCSFTHAGMVVREEDAWWVIHAAPESPVGSNDPPGVRMDSLPEFLNNPQLKALQVVRVNRLVPDGRERVATEAREMARLELPFDSFFDLSTGDSVYCTELIWRAYQSQGVDLLESVTWKRRVFFLDRPLLFPESFSGHPFTTTILDL